MLRYAITDRRRFGGQARLLESAARWAADHLDYIQLREKDLAPGELAVLGRQLMTTLQTHSPPPDRRPRLLINSRADVAVAIGADGVHLTSTPGQLTPADVRRLYASARMGPPIVSVSCHTVEEVSRARQFGSSLILFAPVFEKFIADPCEVRAADSLLFGGSGLDLLHDACIESSPIPVLALGGITEENKADCLHAGAAGIAAIRLFGG